MSRRDETKSGAARRVTPVGGAAAVAVVVVLIALASRSLAHDSPEHVVEILTARIEAVGPRPDLLWRRATEYRVLGNLEAAEKDLRKALKTRQDYLPALTDLGRVQQAQGRHRAALATLARALKAVPEDSGRAPLWMIRADLYSQMGDFEKALADCDRALRHGTGAELDWYLTRSQLQCRLGKFNEAVQGLLDGFALTGSAVLEVEAIDALIDGGRVEEALEKIEPVLADSRWQGSWLIRRARVRLHEGRISKAHEDLLLAIRELNQRVTGTRPGYDLFADRGFAYALLGDLALARNDLQSARKLGADQWTLRRLEVALATRL
jgi:tetratricopeptide (TPR) repeat protein